MKKCLSSCKVRLTSPDYINIDSHSVISVCLHKERNLVQAQVYPRNRVISYQCKGRNFVRLI